MKKLFIAAILFAVINSAVAEMTEQALFRKKVDGYNNMRIPAICKTTKGTLLAFAEGREGGDAGDIDTLIRRSEDDGKTWSKIRVVWSDDKNTFGNPAPIVDHDTGTIWLFSTWNLGTDHEGKIWTGKSEEPRRPYLCKSTDDGKTWSKPVEMKHLRKPDWRWYATGPCNGIQLTRGKHKGRLICPANHSYKADPTKTEPGRNWKVHRSHIIYSDDHPKTWKLGGIHDDLTNESTVAELSDGSVMQNMRNYFGKHNRAVAVSKDGGETFGKLYLDDALQSPTCQASLLRFSWPEDGKSRLMFSSPTDRRNKMTIRISYDEGKTWPVSKLIYKGDGAYSNLIKLSDDKVGLFYEKDGHASMVFATIPLAEIEDKAKL